MGMKKQESEFSGVWGPDEGEEEGGRDGALGV